MATVTVQHKQPVEPEIESVTLVLSPAEARALFIVADYQGDKRLSVVRQENPAVYDTLDRLSELFG